MSLPATTRASLTNRPSLHMSAIGAAPLARARETSAALMWSLVGCAAGLAAVGCVFYGPRTLLLTGVGAAFATLTEGICCWLCQRRWRVGAPDSLAIGLIVALMLPAVAPWYVAAAGAMLGVGAGKWLMGGVGHYPWNPAVLALLALYLLWPSFVAPQRWPLLARQHVLFDSGLRLAPLASANAPLDWRTAEPPGAAIGFNCPRADAILHQVAADQDTAEPLSMEVALRDLLPSWWDMLAGAVAGPIGQGSSLALILAGLVLIWRGYLDWTLPMAVLAGAFAAASALPAGSVGWWPIRYEVGGMPLGLVWTGYHVLLGPTLFAAVLLAGETVTCPLTHRGRVVYGLAVGALTVALRWWPVALMSGCWAVLAMNTLVPLIDTIDRRWRLLAAR